MFAKMSWSLSFRPVTPGKRPPAPAVPPPDMPIVAFLASHPPAAPRMLTANYTPM